MAVGTGQDCGQHSCRDRTWLWGQDRAAGTGQGCRDRAWLWGQSMAVGTGQGMAVGTGQGCGDRAWLWGQGMAAGTGQGCGDSLPQGFLHPRGVGGDTVGAARGGSPRERDVLPHVTPGWGHSPEHPPARVAPQLSRGGQGGLHSVPPPGRDRGGREAKATPASRG